MNFQDKEPIYRNTKPQSRWSMPFKETTSLQQLNQQIPSPFHKKEKRNRKFFLKRTIMLLIIEKETGNINFEKGSDFAHLEIMQGGHFPMNKYAMKDIKSETFNNEFETKEHNVEVCLHQAALSLSNHCQTIRTEKYLKFKQNQKSFCTNKSIQQQHFNQRSSQEQRQIQSISSVNSSNAHSNAQGKQNIDQEIENLKYQLRKQHQTILQSIM